LKKYRNEAVTADPTILCNRCSGTSLSVGRKCSWCTVRCYSTVAAGVFNLASPC